jgi:DNA polymerase IV
MTADVTGFCRNCFQPAQLAELRCTKCRSPKILHHPELHTLSIAHIDCDAFYAAVEKRDKPELRDKPVIIGGQTRGVVSTACYVARIQGVKSAMPMFKALKLCPEAVVIKPNMKKYAEAGKQVREIMLQFTPLVQPISIDEAFLDLNGTAKLHGQSPALSLAKLVRQIENEVGISASIGLSHNKFLAKMASDLEKPRGFSVIGLAETKSFLASKSVGSIWGVGQAMQTQLEKAGITKISHLQSIEKNELMRQFGVMGARLYHLSRGEDYRDVSTESETKSISSETTFDENISEYDQLEPILWDLAQKVSRRAKAANLAGSTITLKLKNSEFQNRSRAASLQEPTRLAHRIFEAAKPLLKKECLGTKFRLLGVGISHLSEHAHDDEIHSLDEHNATMTKAELAIDQIRKKFGNAAVGRGIAFKDKSK